MPTRQISIGSRKVRKMMKDVEKSIKKIFKDKLKKIIIFGSYARGDYDDESDIDFIMVVEDRDLKKFEDIILDIEVDLSIKYSKLPFIFIYNVDDYYSNINVIDLLKNIKNEGIEFYAA